MAPCGYARPHCVSRGGAPAGPCPIVSKEDFDMLGKESPKFLVVSEKIEYTYGLENFPFRKYCMNKEKHKLLSVEDAADTLGVTKQTVTRLIRCGEIDAEKVGNKWVLRDDSLEKYLADNNLVPEPKDHPCLMDGSQDITALSFFSGALGLDLGMEQAGIKPILLCENDRKCRMTIQSERPDAALIGDINEYSPDEIMEKAGLNPGDHVDLIFGGPPCQAFSTAGARRAFDDARGNVFLKYLEVVEGIKPTYIVIENVRGLLSTPFPVVEGGEPQKGGALKLILKKLEDAGYSVSFNLYNAANFGAAQIRERVVLIGKLGKEKVSYLTPTHDADGRFGLPKWRTFRDAVQGLDEKSMHGMQFPEKRLRYFRMLSEGQYWKNLPEEIQREAMGKSYGLSGGKTGFYRRIWFDRPCPTLVTTPTMPATDLCHPTLDRPLTIEEYKRVQGFPDDWQICGDVMDVYKQVGNAVPVALGRAIGKAIIDDMNGVNRAADFEGFPYSRYRHTSDLTWGKV